MEEGFATDSPVYVLHFPTPIKIEDVTWILERIQNGDGEGPTGLVLWCIPSRLSTGGVTVIVSLSRKGRRVIASELRLNKTNLMGRSKKFKVQKLSKFCVDDDDSQLFSSAETLMMIRHQLGSIRSHCHQKLPLSPISFYQGEPIIEKLLFTQQIRLNPLHQGDQLKRITNEWYASHVRLHTIFRQPLDGIRNYWGESEGFFFAFFQSLTLSLIFPLGLGIIQFCMDSPSVDSLLVFTSLYMLWGFLMMEHWKRRTNVLSYSWGTNLSSNSFQRYGEPRPNYRGKLRINPVTGYLQPYYPLWRTHAKVGYFHIYSSSYLFRSIVSRKINTETNNEFIQILLIQ